jgi:hypothetical protein
LEIVDDPEAAAGVPLHREGLADGGLGEDQIDGEVVGGFEMLERFGWG